MRRLLLAPILLAGCQDYLFSQVCPEAIRESSIIVPALQATPADILFIVDNSGSMADEQANLADNFGQFITQIAGAGDYHIAVVSTDQQSAMGERDGLQNFVFSAQPPNILTDFSGSACRDLPIQHGCFRGPDQTKRIVDSMTMDRQTQIDVFGQNVLLGSCGSGNEQGLRAMKSALDQRAGCNQGFLRDGANLIIVIVSDEEDADTTPIQQYVEAVKGVKGGAAQIRVAVIVGYADNRASDCSIGEGSSCGTVCDNPPPRGSQMPCMRDTDCSGGDACIPIGGGNSQCDNPLYRYWNSCQSCSFYNAPDCCSAVAGGRYVQFALDMESEITRADSTVSVTDCQGGGDVRVACRIDTICQANFGATLAAIARDLIPQGTYNLSPPASYPPGVAVTLRNGRFGAEGQKLVYGTDFDVTEDGSVLTLKGANTPREGEDIEIHFVVSSDNRVEAPRGACKVTGTP